MFRPSLTEKMKREIARLYNTTDTSVEAIAAQLNVSGRSVHRFKNYGYSTEDEPQNQPQISYPDEKQGHKKQQRRCKRCGYTTDKNIKGACPGCSSGPFDSISVEIGSPEYEQFIGEKQKWRESEEPENEEYAPDRIESKDPSKYKEPEPQDHEESGDENETNTKPVEEQQPEYEYECPKCHKEFNEVLENCPHCGIPLMDARECPKCHHEWYGSPDRCPKCGADLQE